MEPDYRSDEPWKAPNGMDLLIVGVLTLAGLWSIKNISLFCDIRISATQRQA